MSNVLKGTVVNPNTIYGKSAYEIAVMNGFDGTEEEWLYSLAEEANTIAKAYADNAGDSAQRAEEAKAAAETAETNAQGSAESAAESASAASASAESAESAAGRAESAAGRAEAAEEEAEAHANAASASAQNAAESEQNASAYNSESSMSARNAEYYANEAEGSKVAAETAATNAANSASEASGYAWSAKTDAGRAEAAVTTGRDAAIAEIEAKGEEVAEELGELGTVKYSESISVFLGDNVLGTATLGNGWSAPEGGYKHATGSVADLTFNTAAEDGEIYLLEFDTDYDKNEFVRVGIGDRYRVLCYNGKTHIVVPLMASGGNTLYITPVNDKYEGSISNITLRKIQDEGEECVIEMYSTMTNNHTRNYGFWNTLIGDNTAENAVGSSRCIGIGHHSLAWLQGGHRNIGVGTFTMSQMLGGEENVAIGADSMIYVKKAEGCISIGFGAMSQGVELKKNVAIGRYALNGADDSTSQNNTAVGESAGFNCAGSGNSMLGSQAGYRIREGSNNTMIGANTFGGGKGSNNTAIGAGATYEDGMHCTTTIGYNAKATKSYQTVIGSHTGAWSDTKETLVFGDLVVCGTDGVYRKIVFNADGTCSWVTVNA